MSDDWTASKEVLAVAARILQAGPICDECLGRAFARLEHGYTNGERGQALRTRLAAQGTSGKPGACWVCDGLFDCVEDWAKRALAAVEGIEFDSYLFGVRLTPRLQQAERFFSERFPTDTAEPLKHAFNRETGKAFETLAGRGTLDLTRPHLSFIVNLETGEIRSSILSLYVYGRYRKLVRGIPQTRWPCRSCGGSGCEQCSFTGKQYPESVEELIAPLFLTAADGNEAHLHGAGREDIDARMLGNGRPFVLEIASPRRRDIDLVALARETNAAAAGKVEIGPLRFVGRETVALVKEIHAEKTYRALVSFSEAIEQQALSNAVASLVGVIEQRTPRRVLHRRADLVRPRRLLDAKETFLSHDKAELVLHGEGGLYVKELVSGDCGRTVPNLSEQLGVPAMITELDVIDVSSDLFPDHSDLKIDPQVA